MSEPRRHHLVPQFHLKRFADKKHRIAMVSRDQKKCFTSKVKTACVETDFYSVELENGWSQDVERMLSEIESAGAHAIENMLNGEFPPKPKDREAAAMFVAFQCLRGKELRDGYHQVVDHLVKFQMANITRQDIREIFLKEKGREPTEQEFAVYKTILTNADHVKVVPHQNESIRMMLTMAPGLANTISSRKWLLVDHSEPCLLTSDTPVVRWSNPKRGSFYGVSWVTADELQMPLSTRHCLVMAFELQKKEQVCRLGSVAGPKLAQGINFSVAAHASRWIFHHPEIAPLKGITLPPQSPPLTIDGPKGRIIPGDW